MVGNGGFFELLRIAETTATVLILLIRAGGGSNSPIAGNARAKKTTERSPSPLLFLESETALGPPFFFFNPRVELLWHIVKHQRAKMGEGGRG